VKQQRDEQEQHTIVQKIEKEIEDSMVIKSTMTARWEVPISTQQ